MTAQSAIPLKWYVPFATGDSSRVEIPVTSSDATRASQMLGFPPLTMQPPAVGGVPPQGEDFNGAMNQVARIAWWTLNGGGWPFDATFATNANIGGYPNGAVLQSSDFLGQWISTADNNQNNPDTIGTNWVPGFQYGSTTITGLTGGTTTLTPLQAAKRGISVAGTLTAAQVIVLPAWTKDWNITNNTTGAFTVTVKTAAGSGIVIPQNGAATPVSGDGTNIVQMPQNIAAATGSGNAAQLGQATGRVLRTVVYALNGGVLFASIDGGAFAAAASTFTPYSGLVPVGFTEIEGCGGGGGGGGAVTTSSTQVSVGAGGTSGTWAKVRFAGPITSSPTVTVGAGGGSVAGAAGGAGAQTSLGGLLALPGGGGGNIFTGTSGTSNGVAGLGSQGSAPTTTGLMLYLSAGASGNFGVVFTSNSASGTGGDSPYGSGGGSRASGGGGAGAAGYGGGGGGALTLSSQSAQGGGAGGAGLLIIREYA